MAQSSQTMDRYDVGNNAREDFANVIYNISPTEVPSQSNFGKGTADNTYTEWSTDALATAANNAAIDGDEFSGGALDKAERIGNYCQISRKDIVVSRRANKINKAGRKSEIAYQIAKKAKELRRDVEFAACSRKTAVVGDDSTAMEAAGIPSWIRSNIIRGTSGTAPTLSGAGGIEGYPNGVGTPPTDANMATNALSEADILSVVRQCYDAGGNPNMLMMNTRCKQGFSNYLFSSSASRVATQYQDQGKGPRSGISVVGAVDVYVTDFGVLDIVPNRFMPAYTVVTDTTGSDDIGAEVFVLDTDMWEFKYFDSYKTETIAKIGDHERRMLLVDWTICSHNEAASGIVSDINDTLAVTA